MMIISNTVTGLKSTVIRPARAHNLEAARISIHLDSGPRENRLVKYISNRTPAASLGLDLFKLRVVTICNYAG